MGAQGMNLTGNLGPGRPINPAMGYSITPRAMDYPTGVNQNIQGRTAWGRTSYDTLRGIIDAYDVARMCINHKIDELRSMEPLFVAADGVSGDVDGAIDAARTALEFPDRQTPWDGWLSLWLENVLRYDAGPLYRRRNLDGDVIGLEVLDGTTIVPYVDDNGRRPTAPAPAFAQNIKGMPWVFYTNQDLIYTMFRPQPNSPFGLAPIESVLLSVNTDLRFQKHFLELFTDGTVPNGLMQLPPDTSTPDQVEQWQKYWDAFMAGDQTILHRIVMVPAGSTLTQTKPETFDPTFPHYLMTRVAAAYGVVPQDLGLIEDVNRSNGETQVDVQFRVNTLPWVRFVERTITRYLQKDLGLPVKLSLDTGRDKEDRLAEAQTWAIYVQNAAVSPDEMREELLGLPVDNERKIPRGFVTGKTGFVPLVDVFNVSGPIDPETLAPVDDEPLPLTHHQPVAGVVPEKDVTTGQILAAPLDPDEPEFPGLEKPVPGSGILVPPSAPAAKEASAGVTSATGITGDPTAPVEDEDDDEKTELVKFRRFVKARKVRGVWRDFQFEVIPADVAKLLNAGARAELEGDAYPKAEPVTKGWRDTPAKTPQLNYDLRITDAHQPALADALKAWVKSLDIKSAVQAASKVRKDGAGNDTTAETASNASASADDAAASSAAVNSLNANEPSLDDLQRILQQIRTDGWAAGAHAASEQVPDAEIPMPIAAIDWDTWKPGDTDASALMSDGGFANLLDQEGITLKGITDTLVGEIGNQIADGLDKGLGSDAIARNVETALGDQITAYRAEMIAHTETARAVTTASLQQYDAAGITQFDLIVSDNACDICVAAEADNPHDLDDDAPPLHPRCRCSSAPHVEI